MKKHLDLARVADGFRGSFWEILRFRSRVNYRVPGSEGREGPKGRKKNEAVLQNRTGIKKENKKRVPGYPCPGALVWE